MSGSTLGNYHIVEEIGVGGMASVYKAYDPATERYVAIKILPKYYSQDPTLRERFRREAKAIANLEHPFILPLFGYGEEDGTAYLAMRYMETGTLADRIERESLPLAEVARILEQIAGALDYAHRNGVVHRDVKPSNVLLDNDGNAYLTDFGIAKMVEGVSRLTGSGMALGTPQYMAPEQCVGEDSTPASDIYSLGIVLYQMLTGRLPFDAETPIAVVYKQINDPLPPLPVELGQAVEEVVLAATAKRPDQRFETATALAGAFKQAIMGAAPSEGTADDTQPASVWRTLEMETAREEPRRTRRRIRLWRGGDQRLAYISLGMLTALTIVIVVALIKLDIIPGPEEFRGLALFPTNTPTPSPVPTATPTPTLTPTATLTPTPTLTPTLAPPSGRLAFVSDRTGKGDIYIMGVDGSGLFNLTDDPAEDKHPSWAPGGGRVAFVSDRNGQPDVYVAFADGSSVIRITNDRAGEENPIWSPDGSLIAYQSGHDGNWDIFVTDPLGSAVAQITHDPAAAQALAWSPDSQRLVFASSRSGNADIFVVNIDGRDPRPLTSHAAPDNEPAWSPLDGTRIAFTSWRNANADIYVVNANGGDPVRLTTDPSDDRFPLWSPDGSKIAFVSERDGNQDIYVMNADSSNLVRLTDDPANDFGLVWSPSSQYVAFMSFRDGNSEIYLVPADGSSPPQRLTTSDISFDGAMVWTPN
jgi:Tol biopolymer transport system component/tRNA A-37 threonylcarbamoyl transferase component Bud32